MLLICSWPCEPEDYTYAIAAIEPFSEHLHGEVTYVGRKMRYIVDMPNYGDARCLEEQIIRAMHRAVSTHR